MADSPVMGALGLISLGWGASGRLLGLTTGPLKPDFPLGFGLALLAGGVIYWPRARK